MSWAYWLLALFDALLVLFWALWRMDRRRRQEAEEARRDAIAARLSISDRLGDWPPRA